MNNLDKTQKITLYRIIIASILLIMAIFTDMFSSYELVTYIVIFIIIAYDIVKKAIENIINAQFLDENFLMAFAALAAFILGQYEEAIEVMLFYQVGELFQSMAVSKSRKSISNLMDITPQYANVQRGNEIQVISPDDVLLDDILVIKVGEKIPVDGVVIEGSSSVNTSAITGEFKPRDVSVGDELLSGFINDNKPLKIRATKIFEDSTVSKILELVEESSEKKAKTEKFVTKFARYYTPTVVGLAVFIAVVVPFVSGQSFDMWFKRSLVFLVTSCPCALVISIPLGFFGGIGGASKKGILIKGGEYLENLSKVSTIVFDKTGTLTKGSFEVIDVQTVNIEKEMLLEYTALSEIYSTHPIAESIKRAYGKKLDTTRVKDVQEISGIGISATVDEKNVLVGNSKILKDVNTDIPIENDATTVIYVVIDEKYVGSIKIADEIKENARKTIKDLYEKCSQEIIMLTGDNKAVANNVAQRLGISNVKYELLPQDKASIVEEIIKNDKSGRKVAFVGDGINDAPVLSIADVGIAMGAMGSDAAIESADVVLMDDDTQKIVTAIKISKKTMSIVMQNIIFAIGVKVIVMILGTIGLATIQWGIFADVGVSILAILNASRSLSVKE